MNVNELKGIELDYWVAKSQGVEYKIDRERNYLYYTTYSMQDKKTLFVIGAGSGADFGFPTGPGLTTKIAKLLDIDMNNRDITAGKPRDDIMEA